MTARGRVGVTVWLLVARGLALPAAAWRARLAAAHEPSASVVINGPPAR